MTISRQFKLTVLFALLITGLGCEGKPVQEEAENVRMDAAVATKRNQSVQREHVGTKNRPMMIEFSRDYCVPCQVMKPWIAEIAAEHPSVDVLTLNVDRKRYEHIGRHFQVSAVPSLIYLDADGQVLNRTDGLKTKAQMVQAMRKLGWLQ